MTDRLYAHAIVKMQEEINELSNKTIDQLLVVTMLVASNDVYFVIFPYKIVLSVLTARA